MHDSPLRTGQPPGATPKRRERRSRLDGRVIAYLLRAASRQDQPQDANSIAQALDVPYSTVTATLRRLDRSGRLAATYAVNNFRTPYCHEYQVAIAVDGRAIVNSDKKRRERLAKLPHADRLRAGGTAELFIEELIDGLARNPHYCNQLIICDAVMLHGATERDIELNVLTNDGSYSLGRWIRDELTGNPCIRAVHTVTVGFRYSRNGYSGEHANHQHAAAEGSAANGEP
jgi:DNA-binding Lrp family transcriptional regulator